MRIPFKMPFHVPFKINSFQSKIFLILSSIVTVVVLVISSLTYGYFNMNALNEINSSTSMILEESNLVMENNMDNTIEKTAQLLFDDNIKNYVNNEELSKNPEYVSMGVKIRDSVTLIKESSDLIDSIYVYFNNSNFIITNTGSYHQEDFFENSFINEISRELKENPKNTFFTRIRYYDYDKKMYYNTPYSGRIISLIHPIFNDYMRGFIVVNIRSDKLFYTASSGAVSKVDGGGYSAILDSSRTLIFPEKLVDGKDDTLARNFKTKIQTQGNGFFTEEDSAGKYLILYSPDNKYGWKYVLCLPYSIIYKNIYLFKNVLIIMTLAIILLGIAASYFWASFLYKPIKAIYKAVTNSRGGIDSGLKNELDTIKQYISNISSESDETRDLLSKNLPVLKEVFMHELLMGRINDAEAFKNNRENYNLFTGKENFAVFIMLINDWNRLAAEYKETDRNLFKFAIFDYAINISGDDTAGLYLLSEPDKIILLKGISKDECETVLKLDELADRIQRGVKDNLNQEITISIGMLADTYGDIASSYKSAVEALNYRLIYGNGCIVNALSIKTINTEIYAYPYDKEKLLLIYISNLNREKAELTIDSIFEPEFVSRFSYKFVEQMTIQLLNSLHKFMIDNNIKMSDLFGDTNYYDRIGQKETVSEIKDDFKCICEEIIFSLEQKKSGKGKSIAEDALTYIEQNYNKEINLEIAAHYFNISRQHFSKIFQDRYGKGFNDYLNDFRLDKVKKLLETSDLKLKDICVMVGINNPQYLIKLFKGRFYTTPTDYRKKFEAQ